MARAKKSAIVITLHREVLPNGNIRLTSEYGFIDTRTGDWRSEVVCKPRNERFFKEAVNEK